MQIRTRYQFSAALAGVAFGALPGMAHFDQAMADTTIALFTFERFTAIASSTIGNSFGSYLADAGVNSASATAGGMHTSPATSWDNPSGNGSPHSLFSNRWSVGDYYEFDVDTTNFQKLVVSFDAVTSNSGPKFFQFTYSSNGTDFSSVANLVLANVISGWSTSVSQPAYHFSFDLSAITELNNDPNGKFRLMNLSSNATAGGARIDNFMVVESVPEPATAAVTVMTVAAATMALRRQRN